MLLDYLRQDLMGQHYLLYLDDFQFVNTDPILGNFVERLFDMAADNGLMVIITARHLPDFIQTPELNALEGLSLANTQALLAKRLPSLPSDLAAALYASTGGNPQFLILAIDALQHTRNPARLIAHLTEADNIERYLLNEVDAKLTAEERALMGTVAVLLGYPSTRQGIEMLTGENVRRTLHTLRDRYLLVVIGDEGDHKYSQQSMVQAFYYDTLAEDKRCKLHQQAGEYYLQEKDFIQAATHWYRADNVAAATTMLFDNFRVIVNTGKSRAFYDLQAKFPKEKLSDTAWAKLKIAAGRAALLTIDIPVALAELSEALNTNDIYYKVQALYYRAQAFKTISYGESLAHFNRGIQLLEGASVDAQVAELLVDLYVGMAWLYIEESPNLDEAESNLTKAQNLIGRSDFHRQSDLFNAWAGLCVKQKDTKRELSYLNDAWNAATKTQDSEMIIKTAHNLGQAYIWAGQPETGFKYLQQALGSAIEIGNLQGQGKCYQTMGAGYFLQEQYEQAIHHYKLAYGAYQKTGNQNWLGWVCYDLAEVCAKIGNPEQGQNYLNQATVIAEKLGAQDLHSALARLIEQFPEYFVKESEPCSLHVNSNCSVAAG